ncbi:MAG TPA: hypothetical protein VHU40_07785, partial [Polyangia bacterium]|nr:hypothetical protein [Polyangia bacterium]
MHLRSACWSRASRLTIGLGCVLLATTASCDDGRHPAHAGASGGAGGAGGAGTGSGGTSTDAGAPAWQWTVACPDGHEPTSPIDFGDCAIQQALATLAPALPSAPVIVARALDATAPASDVPPQIAALVDARPESYVIVPGAEQTLIVGRDATGAMYGALELAERLRLHGPAILASSSIIRGAPAVGFRASNLFWTVKAPNESKWWFLDEGFWHQYLDLMASARLNMLDLHAMYDPATTVFPNALLYLARSASYPDVGAPAAERDANLAMFNKVVAMAAARGIRVGLMTYQARTTLDGYSDEVLDAEAQKVYTREATADLVTRIPGLAVLGFRIGEGGKPAVWYIDTLVAGAHQARPDMPLYTRTWGSGKDEILKLADAFGPGAIVESKYNGEQIGPPYVIAGGNFIGYSSYSYQNYLTPPAPWSFVFQVRTAGTHRFFRAASYERARRAVLSLGQLSPSVRGFTLEPPHAYNEQRDVFHAMAADRPSPWTFVRDDLMYLLWGRLGYDPTTPEATFRALAARELGSDRLWDAIQAADDIVPWIQTGHTCGPDHRDFNPEMELGGDVAQWAGLKKMENCAYPGPFDTFAIASPKEAAADLVAKRATSRITPMDIAAHVLDDVAAVDAALQAFGAGATATALPKAVLARDVVRE